MNFKQTPHPSPSAYQFLRMYASRKIESRPPAGSSVAPRRGGFPRLKRGLKPTPTIIKSLRDHRLAERGHDGSRGFQPTESHNQGTLVAARWLKLDGRTYFSRLKSLSITKMHPPGPLPLRRGEGVESCLDFVSHENAFAPPAEAGTPYPDAPYWDSGARFRRFCLVQD